MGRRTWLAGMVVLAVGCGRDVAPPPMQEMSQEHVAEPGSAVPKPSGSLISELPVDPAIPPAAAGEDGQPWQVYVETETGERTYLYAQRLQIGTLTLRLSHGSEGQGSTVLLLEHLPDQLTVYEASYAGPQDVSVAVGFQRTLDPRRDGQSPLPLRP